VAAVVAARRALVVLVAVAVPMRWLRVPVVAGTRQVAVAGAVPMRWLRVPAVAVATRVIA
jgi:hypothetical protein